MNLINILKKLYKKIGRENNVAFIVDIDKQMDYFKTLKEPKDDFQRSYNQYKCQQFILPLWERILKNFVAFFLVPFYLLSFYIKGRTISAKEKFDAIFIQNGMNKNIIPKSLHKKYSSIKVVSFTEKMALKHNEIKLIFKCIKKYPLSPYFHFKIMFKLAIYCAQIEESRPKAIISYSETSFSSAIVTQYCEIRRVDHINVMHGDFLKRITFSYFRFTSFYVWDEYYINMFRSLGNYNTQYFVEIPTSLSNACNRPRTDEQYPYFLTYYLSNEDESTLKKIENALKILSIKGLKCKIRIHPRESDIKLVNKIFIGYKIEEPKYISLQDSLNQTKCVCALCSTVLYQAWSCEKNIIIDDYSNQINFNVLNKLNYMLLNKNHKLLSNLL